MAMNLSTLNRNIILTVIGVAILGLSVLGIYVFMRRSVKPLEPARRLAPPTPENRAVQSNLDGSPATQSPIANLADSPYHKKVRSIYWLVNEEKAAVQAEVYSLKVPLQNAPAKLPISYLKITSVPSNKAIYEENVEDRLVTMYTRDLDNDDEEELIIVWNGGAVSENLQILSVKEEKVTVILAENYRVKAEFVTTSDNMVDVLVTTGEHGSGPFHTTRYSWKGARYQPVSRDRYQPPRQ